MPLPGIFPPPFPCEVPVAEVAQATQQALDAMARSDVAGFYQAADSASRGLPCLTQPLDPHSSAQLHQVMAVQLLFQKDNEGAAAALRAATLADASTPLPPALTLSLKKLGELEQSARSAPTPSVSALTIPLGATVRINGSAALNRPEELPVLVQVLWEDGVVHWSAYVPAGQDLDLSRLGPPPPPRPELTCADLSCAAPPCPNCPERAPGPGPLLTASALGSTALAAGLYGWGVHTNSVFWAEDTPTGDLEGLARRSTALQWAALGVGVVGLSLDGVMAARVVRALKP